MTYTELVEKARELGVAIQDTDEFTAFIVPKLRPIKAKSCRISWGSST